MTIYQYLFVGYHHDNEGLGLSIHENSEKQRFACICPLNHNGGNAIMVHNRNYPEVL